MRSTESGVSLVELMIATVLVPMVLGMGIFALRSAGALSTTVVNSTSSLDKLRHCLRRIGDEIMCSSQTAEDQNGNHKLDAGEDTNGNGRLEDDWAVTASSITFNRALPDGTWSLPIRYRLEDGRIIRSELQAGGKTVSAEIASAVLAFAVLVADKQVTVSLSVGKPANPQASTIAVTQRN